MRTRLNPGAKIHFSGIGGKGIAPAASLALQAGYDVTGDDLIENHRTAALRAAGATIMAGRNEIPDGVEAVVASSSIDLTPGTAIAADPAAPARRPVTLQRLEFVQHVFARHGKDQIAVAGSVGKSSAAAITTSVFAPTDPSCYIGADVDTTLCGATLAAGPWAVTEACEYRDAYLALAPKIALILNLTTNHEDHFGDGTAGFAQSLRTLIDVSAGPLEHVVTTSEAAFVLNQHGLGIDRAAHTIGQDGADWQLSIDHATPDSTRFSLRHAQGRDTFEVPLTGPHSATAAALAVVAARYAGLSDADIRAGLALARLPQRRMSLVHTAPGLSVYDDNARLPVQLTSLLAALRQCHPRQPIIAVISPWGRRNRRDLAQWAAAAAQADFVYVLPVGDASTAHGGAEYPASAVDLVDLIHHIGGSAQAVNSPGEIAAPGVSEAAPQVYVTAGYDTSQPVFAEIHRNLQVSDADSCVPCGTAARS
ncbi:Mur ligase domain-containing protein [Kribbella sp. NBC_01245]|uniref:Mur ligase domain-containing protein n=1 Tax=Kribbella sp. NBC_01245 TaxID=2903578 RepID=UPI002E2E3008|nr:Mur ligase domain-containing protein [Kribbella sp. NBC_01245]